MYTHTHTVRSAFKELFRIFRLYCTHYIHFRSKNRTIIVIFYFLLHQVLPHSYQKPYNSILWRAHFSHLLSFYRSLFPPAVPSCNSVKFVDKRKRKHTSRTWFDQDNIVSISVYFSIHSCFLSSLLEKATDRKVDRKVSATLILLHTFLSYSFYTQYEWHQNVKSTIQGSVWIYNVYNTLNHICRCTAYKIYVVDGITSAL